MANLNANEAAFKLLAGQDLLSAERIELAEKIGSTNASINSAIAENPTNTRLSAGLLSEVIVGHEEAIHHFMDQLIDLQATEYPSDGKYIVVGGGGDSMGTSQGFMPYVVQEMIRRFGQGCVASSTFAGVSGFGSGQLSTTITYSGSAAAVTENFAYLPNGDYHSIPSGSSLTETPASPNITAGYRKIRCWYANRSGGGTLSFTVAQNGVSLTAKTVDTNAGTAGTIGYIDFDLADGVVLNGKPTLTVSSSGGTSHYIGCYMYLGSGYIPVAVGRGGSSYAQALSSNAANLATLCDAMDMRLCFHAVKEEDNTWANLGLMMDRWAAQHSRCSHIWVGATASPSGNTTTDPASNNAMKIKAMALKMCFIDGQELLRNVAYLDSIGSTTNGWNQEYDIEINPNKTAPHLSLPARRFIAGWIIQKVLLGLHVSGGRFSPATLESMHSIMLSNTRIAANLLINTTINGAGSTFTHTPIDFTSATTIRDTNTLGRFVIGFNNTTPPVGNTYRAGRIQFIGPSLNTRRIYRYAIADGFLNDGVMACLLLGGNGQNEVMGLTGSGGGVRIIHGVDTISSQAVPFIQFAVKGTGSSETLSPKIYHSTTASTGIYAGGTWRQNTDNFYWVEIIGNGASNTKRFRAWHQPIGSGSSETRLASRRLIADWSGNISASGATYAAESFFGLYTNSSPSAPAGVRSIALSAFEVEFAPRFATDFSQQDMNL